MKRAMKFRHVMGMVCLICTTLSCRKKEIEPSQQFGIKGSWRLFQSSIWDGNTSPPQPVSPNPPQIITFGDFNRVSTSAIGDTLLRGATYYDISYADYPGHLLHLYTEMGGTAISSSAFSIHADTLFMNSLRYGKQFRFVRL